MANKDMRDWMAKIDEIGELKRITAEVDWNLELAGVARRIANQVGPALLFENIKDHKNTKCRKLFLNGLGSRQRLAMALGLPRETGYREIVRFIKDRMERLVDPIILASGPVKDNIVKGDAVSLHDFPVPKYNELDGGRYINTRGCVVTMDPDTKIMNIGLYRGMVGDDGKSIPVMLESAQHWGLHFLKYKERGEPMPVAVVYGWDPTLMLYASTSLSHPGYSEYELLGGLRGEPVELVKCETSDLYVPASAEIVIEGWISTDPKAFQMEGPFGEYPGFYAGMRQPKPTIDVKCITHRDDPIFRGGLCGAGPGFLIEINYWDTCLKAALLWKALETAGVPNVVGVWGDIVNQLTNVRVQIDKAYRGHAKQVAAACWGSKASRTAAKNIIVVDKDIDIYDDQAVAWALSWRTNAGMGDIQIFPGTMSMTLDPSIPLPERDASKYGAGKWARVLTDATVNWDLDFEEQYGGQRQPPTCYEISPKTVELIDRRWPEYGL